MNFKSVYDLSIVQQGLQPDPAQLDVVEKMSDLFAQLSRSVEDRSVLVAAVSLLLSLSRRSKITQGCYLWGGVGRGKTWLMDMFYESIPYDSKTRLHYQHFMQQVHIALSQLKGQANPLAIVAQRMIKQTRLICLDEFHVLDITDAMLLHGLLGELYKLGVVFVMTSNLPPDELYKNGLQRDRFIPAIDLIKRNNKVIACNGEWDYRLSEINNGGNYFSPLGDEAQQMMAARLNKLASSAIETGISIVVNTRPILTHFHAAGVVWFDFNELCAGPRAASDYIEIADRYPTVFLSDVYQMDEASDDVARRFINLIDEFYDRGTRLVISANHLPRYLYTGKRLAFEFERTVSRLEEMRSSHD